MGPQPPTLKDQGLRKSLTVSAALHLAVLLFLYFGLPHFYAPLPEPSVPVPFTIVNIAEMTNTRIKKMEEPKAPPPPPKPEVKAYAPPSPPTPPQPPQPEAKPQAVPQVEALVPTEKPKKIPPKAKPKPAKQQPDFLASVLKDVSKMKATETPPITDKKSQATAPSKTAQNAAPSLSDRLTISEEDALRRQIEQFWNMPIGARDASSLVVEVQITVNPDRTVASASVVDQSRVATDPYFRAAAEAALRALDHFRYQPLDLPDGKYDQWKTIDFTFDPRDML